MSRPEVVELHAVVDGKPAQTFIGRVAWMLDKLVEAGEVGVTPIAHPAPRQSHYTFMLRRAGVLVETIHEGHGGAYSGHHARYVLRSNVHVLKTIRQGEGRGHAAA